MTVFAARGSRDYDLIILGGGSAGIVAGVMAGGLGLRTLLIEKNRMGGECLNTGCVPSKALLHAARVVKNLQKEAAALGLPARTLSREEARPALEWARRAVSVVRDADATEQLLRDNGVTIRLADARFRDAHSLLLTEGGGAKTSVVTSDDFLLATGSRPAIPEDIPGLAETPFLTNQTIFDIKEIPERLLVVGGGPVGVEMAQAFQRLGSRVTLVQSGSRLLPRDDAELAALLTEHLRAEGIDIRLNARLERIAPGGTTAFLRTGDTRAEISFDRLLLATGRVPNVEGLSLDSAGVNVGKNGITVDAQLRTTAPNLYACGDVVDSEYQFSHIAEYQAKIAVRNLTFPGEAKTGYRAAPWATFTEPELAHVGLNEEEARARNIAFEVYRQPFAQNDRALTDGEADFPGMVKVLVEPGIRGRILGAQILGPRAGELLQEWTLAMEQGHSIRVIADMVHVYPTLSMASQHAAQRWYESQAKAPVVRRALDTYLHAIRPREKPLAVGAAAAVILGGAAAALLRLRRRPDAGCR